MKLMVLKPEGSSYQMYDAICEKIVSVGFNEPQTVYCKADTDDMARQMRLLSKRCDILIVTGEMGGQGCARLAASYAFGHTLAFSDKAWEHIQRKCSFTDQDAADFKNCAKLPQYSMPVTGSGVIPACFSVNDDLALLMFDEKLDQKLLERFESLLLTLCSSDEPEPEPKPEPAALPAPVRSAAKPSVKRRKPSASQSSRAKSRRRHIKRTRRNALILIACIAFSAILLIAAACSLLSDISDNSADDKGSKKASATVVADSKAKDKADKKDKEKEDEPEKKPQSSSKVAESSSKPAESSKPNSSAPLSSSVPASSAVPVQQPATSETSPTPPPVESTAPQPSYTEVPVTPPAEQPQPSQPSQPEEQPEPEENVTMEYTYTSEEDDERPSGNTRGLPTADRDAFDERLSYTTDRGTKSMNAYDLVCQILMNETNGLFEHEALKAHAVATYSMLKYNNERGIAPSVLLKSNVTESIEDAVSEVLGVAAYYNGEYANTVYHSTSSGKTTSSESVWGGAFPYLVPVKSKYDSNSPYYKTSYTVDSDKLARLVDRVYGIELDGDPDDWFEIKHDAPGGYVGTVIIGGETHGQGGTWGRKEITGRSFRENLLSYAIRSHCFDIEYDESNDWFFITTYGYGHGVGMSQYGAHFMAQQGYTYVEILEHYYTGVEVY